jgi:serine/threonine-protein kinase
LLPERIGKYAVIRKIASGGMAEVYLCRLTGEEGFEKKVAVKVIHPRLSKDRHFRDLFIREARIAASLVHPNLIQVFDFGKEGESHFLAMEFIDGWNLSQAVSQARLRAMPLPLPVWRYWVEGILAGVGHLHSRGIVHRDISPSNVLLSRGGEVKITDFGIARGTLFGDGDNTGWEGKFAYMSPEQARGEEASTGSDLFAVAVISAELFLQRRLFDEGSGEKTLHKLQRYESQSLDLGGLPHAVAGIVKKGLSSVVADRYVNADEFSRAVCAAVPSSAGRADLESFWDALFPGSIGEEDTVAAAHLHERGPEIIRENRQEYGGSRGRLLATGVVAALAALSAGGWAVWKRTGPAESLPATSQPPAVVTRDSNLLPEVSSHGEDNGGSPYRSGSISSVTPQMKPDVRAPETRSKTVFIHTDPSGVSIALEDGTPLGKTPMSLDIAQLAGKKIVFRQEGYARKTIQADVLAQFKTFRLELERQMGTIEVVQAIPWAKVFDGDRYVGITPIRSLELPVGPHRLRFVNEPLAMEKVLEINVRPGDNPKFIVSFVEKKRAIE